MVNWCLPVPDATEVDEGRKSDLRSTPLYKIEKQAGLCMSLEQVLATDLC